MICFQCKGDADTSTAFNPSAPLKSHSLRFIYNCHSSPRQHMQSSLARTPFAATDTRQPDPGFINDTFCPFALLELAPTSSLLNDALLP